MARVLRRKVTPKRELSHLDARGRARMVDVGAKKMTRREAVAKGTVRMDPATLSRILAGDIEKGEVIAVARVAGIMAAKRTAEIVPMCHPLMIDSVQVDLERLAPGELGIEARVRIIGKTGVEMEALMAVSAAALTVYDMCKAIDRGMVVTDIRLVEKRGGRSGLFRRQD